MPTSWELTSDLNIRAMPGSSDDIDIWDTLVSGSVVEEMGAPGWCPIEMEDGTVGWLSRRFLKTYVEPPAPVGIPTPPPTVIVPANREPLWIQWARKQLGQHEVPGPADNPVIEAWYHLTTLPPELWHDATAWCAVFINAGLMLSNVKTIRSARAVDWLGWGVNVDDDPQKGDVAVFEWSSGGHHVAYVLKVEDGRVFVIGGNQHDAVTLTSYDADNVIGYRRAA